MVPVCCSGLFIQIKELLLFKHSEHLSSTLHPVSLWLLVSSLTQQLSAARREQQPETGDGECAIGSARCVPGGFIGSAFHGEVTGEYITAACSGLVVNLVVWP